MIRHSIPANRYTYIDEAIGTPPYLGTNDGAGLPVRPYIGAYAKPSDTALEVKQALYYLDLEVTRCS